MTATQLISRCWPCHPLRPRGVEHQVQDSSITLIDAESVFILDLLGGELLAPCCLSHQSRIEQKANSFFRQRVPVCRRVQHNLAAVQGVRVSILKRLTVSGAAHLLGIISNSNAVAFEVDG